MTFQVKVFFTGNRHRLFKVDAKNAKYLSQIGLYERREGYIGFQDLDFKTYVFALQTVEAIELEENK